MGRLTRECVITEKIDGTNAQVQIVPRTEVFSEHEPFIIADGGENIMFAGSRTRYVTPANDNMGFAAWVYANSLDLWALGPGRHYGEWWGGKIQRGYGLTEKRFSLFNTSRWVSRHVPVTQEIPDQQWAPSCCHVVPTLYRGLFGERAVDNMLERLHYEGSVAAPGFKPAEGIVIFHTATGVMFKKTLDNDAKPKGQASAAA